MKTSLSVRTGIHSFHHHDQISSSAPRQNISCSWIHHCLKTMQWLLYI